MKTKEFIRLLEKIGRGDMRAMEKLYDGCFSRIFYSAYIVVRNRQDAYDVAMQVFLKLCNYPSDIYSIRNPEGLVCAMAKNAAKDFLRSQKRSVSLLPGHECVQASDDGLFMADILDCLDEREQIIFEHRVIRGETFSAVAELLGVSAVTVKRKYKTIKVKIKNLYSKGD